MISSNGYNPNQQGMLKASGGKGGAAAPSVSLPVFSGYNPNKQGLPIQTGYPGGKGSGKLTGSYSQNYAMPNKSPTGQPISDPAYDQFLKAASKPGTGVLSNGDPSSNLYSWATDKQLNNLKVADLIKQQQASYAKQLADLQNQSSPYSFGNSPYSNQGYMNGEFIQKLIGALFGGQ